ncbi:amino acid permease [Carbonactinospora thermoautotrophica]|uniref:Amino acid permease n=1 Tax=Carbonactinospora thermoautotrophica TaxID=1469144 RepID=A0A132N0V8_9ACTN|nr:APC family permease [Carbonactinospora thermoautotrophica]KWX03616.1 amino acid permease [Carbonactinospora thermoautotrophica]KWX09001.1 amino acid permease [Carbonactinospora thermoautotrophica]
MTTADRTAATEPALRRVIGPKLLLFFVIGDILGTGIYALTGKVAGEVGGAAWLSFALSFAVALFTASSYVELVGKYPRAAGAALYAHRAFGIPFLTFLVAFAVMSSGLTSASAAARAFGGDYLAEFVALPSTLVAIAFVVALALINFRGVSESVKTNVVLTCVELSGLLIVIAIGFIALSRGTGDPGQVLEFKEGANPVTAVVSGAALAFFAMVGFEDSVNMAEETKDPQRAFPRALFLGITVTGIVYILVAACSTMLVPIPVLERSSGPLLEVVKAGAPGFPLQLFALVALFAVSNSALINLLMASRLVYGMARERIIPGVFGAVHPLRRTPRVAILFTTLLAIGLIVFGDIRELGGTTALLLLGVFTLVNAAVLVLHRDKVEHEHYRAPTVLPVLGVLTCAYLASPLSGRDPEQYVLAAVLLGIGVLLWAVNLLFLRGRRRFAPEKITGPTPPEKTG